MKRSIFTLLLLTPLLFFITLTTHAQAPNFDTFGDKPTVGADGTIDATKSGFVPCSGVTCSPCDLVVLFNTVLKWFMTMAFLLFAVLAILAGFKLISSGGNPGALKEAKGSFANAFIGLLIILSAWLIVDTLLRKLLPSGNGEISGYGPWSSVQCATQTVADTSGSFEGDAIYYAADIETAGPGSTINNGGTSVPTVPPSNMTSLRAIGVKVASWSGTNGPGRTDLTHPTVAQTILRMQNQWKASHADKYPFQVTAAYTNSVGHSSGSQHYTGKAVDLQPVSGGASYDEIIKMCRSAGFTFVNDERAVHHIHCDMR